VKNRGEFFFFFPCSAHLGTAFGCVELQLNRPFQNPGSATAQHKLSKK